MAVKTEPVSDSVPKINDEVAVGQDLKFQRKWWHFERAVWICFGIVVALDLAGAFGRGPLAKRQFAAPDHSMTIQYEGIERFSTPSILRVTFGPPAIHDGKAQLWVSDSLVKKLGNQRVVPQPVESAIGHGGILYTFSATELPAQVEFALSPSSPGTGEIRFQVPGHSEANLKIFIVP
jgi:hypothetical protein